MKTKLIHITFIIAFLLLGYSATAQNFNYKFQQSNQTYTLLDDSTKTVISSLENVVELPIGFSFDFAGKVVNKVTLRTTGLLQFDSENKFNFIFLNKEFLNDSSSSISYLIEADQYNRKILKIEFENVFIQRDNEKIYFNFQVWLYQYTNVIEFRMGAVNGNLSTENYVMGLINMFNTEEAPLGYLLQNSADNATSVFVPAKGQLTELSTLPANGTVYQFTPATN